MRRKTELIQQIRAIESVPVITMKAIDLTATSGVGLLSEMSVVEVTTPGPCLLALNIIVYIYTS